MQRLNKKSTVRNTEKSRRPVQISRNHEDSVQWGNKQAHSYFTNDAKKGDVSGSSDSVMDIDRHLVRKSSVKDISSYQLNSNANNVLGSVKSPLKTKSPKKGSKFPIKIKRIVETPKEKHKPANTLNAKGLCQDNVVSSVNVRSPKAISPHKNATTKIIKEQSSKKVNSSSNSLELFSEENASSQQSIPRKRSMLLNEARRITDPRENYLTKTSVCDHNKNIPQKQMQSQRSCPSSIEETDIAVESMLSSEFSQHPSDSENKDETSDNLGMMLSSEEENVDTDEDTLDNRNQFLEKQFSTLRKPHHKLHLQATSKVPLRHHSSYVPGEYKYRQMRTIHQAPHPQSRMYDYDQNNPYNTYRHLPPQNTHWGRQMFAPYPYSTDGHPSLSSRINPESHRYPEQPILTPYGYQQPLQSFGERYPYNTEPSGPYGRRYNRVSVPAYRQKTFDSSLYQSTSLPVPPHHTYVDQYDSRFTSYSRKYQKSKSTKPVFKRPKSSAVEIVDCSMDESVFSEEFFSQKCREISTKQRQSSSNECMIIDMKTVTKQNLKKIERQESEEETRTLNLNAGKISIVSESSDEEINPLPPNPDGGCLIIGQKNEERLAPFSKLLVTPGKPVHRIKKHYVKRKKLSKRVKRPQKMYNYQQISNFDESSPGADSIFKYSAYSNLKPKPIPQSQHEENICDPFTVNSEQNSRDLLGTMPKPIPLSQHEETITDPFTVNSKKNSMYLIGTKPKPIPPSQHEESTSDHFTDDSDKNSRDLLSTKSPLVFDPVTYSQMLKGTDRDLNLKEHKTPNVKKKSKSITPKKKKKFMSALAKLRHQKHIDTILPDNTFKVTEKGSLPKRSFKFDQDSTTMKPHETPENVAANLSDLKSIQASHNKIVPSLLKSTSKLLSDEATMDVSQSSDKSQNDIEIAESINEPLFTDTDIENDNTFENEKIKMFQTQLYPDISIQTSDLTQKAKFESPLSAASDKDCGDVKATVDRLNNSFVSSLASPKCFQSISSECSLASPKSLSGVKASLERLNESVVSSECSFDFPKCFPGVKASLDRLNESVVSLECSLSPPTCFPFITDIISGKSDYLLPVNHLNNMLIPLVCMGRYPVSKQLYLGFPVRRRTTFKYRKIEEKHLKFIKEKYTHPYNFGKDQPLTSSSSSSEFSSDSEIRYSLITQDAEDAGKESDNQDTCVDSHKDFNLWSTDYNVKESEVFRPVSSDEESNNLYSLVESDEINFDYLKAKSESSNSNCSDSDHCEVQICDDQMNENLLDSPENFVKQTKEDWNKEYLPECGVIKPNLQKAESDEINSDYLKDKSESPNLNLSKSNSSDSDHCEILTCDDQINENIPDSQENFVEQTEKDLNNEFSVLIKPNLQLPEMTSNTIKEANSPKPMSPDKKVESCEGQLLSNAADDLNCHKIILNSKEIISETKIELIKRKRGRPKGCTRKKRFKASSANYLATNDSSNVVGKNRTKSVSKLSNSITAVNNAKSESSLKQPSTSTPKFMHSAYKSSEPELSDIPEDIISIPVCNDDSLKTSEVNITNTSALTANSIHENDDVEIFSPGINLQTEITLDDATNAQIDPLKDVLLDEGASSDISSISFNSSKIKKTEISMLSGIAEVGTSTDEDNETFVANSGNICNKIVPTFLKSSSEPVKKAADSTSDLGFSSIKTLTSKDMKDMMKGYWDQLTKDPSDFYKISNEITSILSMSEANDINAKELSKDLYRVSCPLDEISDNVDVNCTQEHIQKLTQGNIKILEEMSALLDTLEEGAISTADTPAACKNENADKSFDTESTTKSSDFCVLSPSVTTNLQVYNVHHPATHTSQMEMLFGSPNSTDSQADELDSPTDEHNSPSLISKSISQLKTINREQIEFITENMNVPPETDSLPQVPTNVVASLNSPKTVNIRPVKVTEGVGFAFCPGSGYASVVNCNYSPNSNTITPVPSNQLTDKIKSSIPVGTCADNKSRLQKAYVQLQPLTKKFELYGLLWRKRGHFWKVSTGGKSTSQISEFISDIRKEYGNSEGENASPSKTEGESASPSKTLTDFEKAPCNPLKQYVDSEGETASPSKTITDFEKALCNPSKQYVNLDVEKASPLKTMTDFEKAVCNPLKKFCNLDVEKTSPSKTMTDFEKAICHPLKGLKKKNKKIKIKRDLNEHVDAKLDKKTTSVTIVDKYDQGELAKPVSKLAQNILKKRALEADKKLKASNKLILEPPGSFESILKKKTCEVSYPDIEKPELNSVTTLSGIKQFKIPYKKFDEVDKQHFISPLERGYQDESSSSPSYDLKTTSLLQSGRSVMEKSGFVFGDTKILHSPFSKKCSSGINRLDVPLIDKGFQKTQLLKNLESVFSSKSSFTFGVSDIPAKKELVSQSPLKKSSGSTFYPPVDCKNPFKKKINDIADRLGQSQKIKNAGQDNSTDIPVSEDLTNKTKPSNKSDSLIANDELIADDEDDDDDAADDKEDDDEVDGVDDDGEDYEFDDDNDEVNDDLNATGFKKSYTKPVSAVVNEFGSDFGIEQPGILDSDAEFTNTASTDSECDEIETKEEENKTKNKYELENSDESDESSEDQSVDSEPVKELKDDVLSLLPSDDEFMDEFEVEAKRSPTQKNNTKGKIIASNVKALKDEDEPNPEESKILFSDEDMEVDSSHTETEPVVDNIPSLFTRDNAHILIPKSYCYFFVTNDSCRNGGDCHYRHIIPPQEEILEHLSKQVTQGLKDKRPKDVVDTFMLAKDKGIGILYNHVKPVLFSCLTLGYSYTQAARSIISTVFQTQLLDAEICDGFIKCCSVQRQECAPYLWEIFEVIQSLNIQPCSESLITLLMTFYEGKKLKELFKIMIYCNELDFVVPVFIREKALEQAILDPPKYRGFAGKWIFQAGRELLMESLVDIDSELLMRLNDMFVRSQSNEIVERMNYILHHKPQSSGSTPQIEEPEIDREEAELIAAPGFKDKEHQAEEKISVTHRIRGCKLTKNWECLASIYVELCGTAWPRNSDFIDWYVDTISSLKIETAIVEAFIQFVTKLQENYEKEKKLNVLLEFDARCLSHISLGIVNSCCTKGYYVSGYNILMTMFQQGIRLSSRKPDTIHETLQTALEVCQQSKVPLSAIRVLEDVYWLKHNEEEICNIDKYCVILDDLIVQLVKNKHCYQAYQLLQFLIEILERGGRSIEEMSGLENHFNEIMGQSLQKGVVETALKVFYLDRKKYQRKHVLSPVILRSLFSGCYEMGKLKDGESVFQYCVSREDIYIPQIFSDRPRQIVIGTDLTYGEVKFVLQDYLKLLYRFYCNKTMDGEPLTTDDLNIRVVLVYANIVHAPFLATSTPQSEYAAHQLLSLALKCLSPPIMSVFNGPMNAHVLSPKDLQIYLNSLDAKELKQGLRFGGNFASQAPTSTAFNMPRPNYADRNYRNNRRGGYSRGGNHGWNGRGNVG